MKGDPENNRGRRESRWRTAAWSAAALVLLLPVIAMQFTDEVAWSPGGFVAAGVLLGGLGLLFELAVRRTGNTAYRAAIGVALAAVLLLLSISFAVGIIGSEDDPANLMYVGALAVGGLGALLARFRPRGMARAASATALALLATAAITLIAGWGTAGPIWPWEVLVLNGFFAALFAGSAVLFQRAAREQPRPDAGSQG